MGYYTHHDGTGRVAAGSCLGGTGMATAVAFGRFTVADVPEGSTFVNATISGGAAWDGQMAGYGTTGARAYHYITLNVIDHGKLAGPPQQGTMPKGAPFGSRYINQKTLECDMLQVCHSTDKGSATADFQTVLQRGHTYTAYYEVYCEATTDLAASINCDYGENFTGAKKVTVGDITVRVADDLAGLIRHNHTELHKLQADLATHDARIDGHLTEQDTALTTHDGKIDSHLTRQDEALAAFRAADLAQFIQASLASCTYHPTLYLPAAHGGDLETVRDALNTWIAQSQRAGAGVGNAPTFYNQGVAALGKQGYKEAYRNFCQSYQQLTSGPTAP